MPERSSTSDAATVRSAGCWRPAAPRSSGSTRRGIRSASLTNAGAGRPICARPPTTLPFADASFDAAVACLVFEHIDAVDAAIAEVARVTKPGGRFCFFLNHPLLQTPGSGWIDDHIIDPPEQYWRIGPYLVESESIEQVELGVVHPLHPPSAVALHQHARRTRSDAGTDDRAGAPAGLPRPCSRVSRGGDHPAPVVLCASAAMASRARSFPIRVH